MKKYMVVERHKVDCFEKVYHRFDANGRMLPAGLYYLHSWINEKRSICFQLLETNDPTLFAVSTEKWPDLTDFEIIPID